MNSHEALCKRYEADPESYDVWFNHSSLGWSRTSYPNWSVHDQYHLVPRAHRDTWQAWLEGELQFLCGYCWVDFDGCDPPSLSWSREHYRRKPKLAPVATEFAAKTAAVRAAASKQTELFLRSCHWCDKLIGAGVSHVCRPKQEPEYYEFDVGFSYSMPWPHWEPLPEGTEMWSFTRKQWVSIDWQMKRSLINYERLTIRIPRASKPPMSGEWWELGNGSIVWVIGTDTDGEPIIQCKENFIVPCNREAFSRWLSDCKGFES